METQFLEDIREKDPAMTPKTLRGYLASAGLLSIFLAALPAAAQQFICNTPPETFTNGIPAGWSIVDSAGNGLVWGGLSVCAEPGNYTGGNFTGGTGEAACVSSSVYGSAAFDTKLVSPVFSLVGVPSASLDFNTNYQDFETADLLDVDISTNGGTSWTTLVRWNEDHGTFRDRPGEHARIDLSPFLGMSNLRVRWRYYDLTPGALDWYAQVDDVALKCAVCGPMLADPLVDRSFEAGSPSAAWAEASASFGTPLCSSSRCGLAGARTGDWWASFGGTTGTTETASLQQTVVIDQGKAWLTFFLWNPESSGNGTDALRVRVDGTQVVSIPAGNSLYTAGYTRVVVDLAAYADGGSHAIRFETSTSGSPAASKFFVDDVSLTICEPPPVAVSVSDAVGDEGNFGTRNLTFTVSLDFPSDQTITLDYATAAAGADPKATAGTDYTATSGSLQFLPGETQKTVLVPVLGDTLDEKDESFNLNLSNVLNAGHGDVQAVGMIVDDDTGHLLLDDPYVEEGNAGTAVLAFPVSLSPAADHEVTVVFRTVTGGTATPGSDYTAVADTTIRFLAGETSKTVNVNVTGDLVDEDDETVLATLSDITGGAVFGKANGSGTILNDDPAFLKINDVSMLEGSSGPKAMSFTVTLTKPSSRTVTVNAATANGTAIAGSDYTATGTVTLTFAPGETSKAMTVTINGDVLDEVVNELFYVNLLNAQNAEIEDPQGVGTIQDDDTSSITIADASKLEGNSGTSALNFTVSLSVPNSRAVTVQYATVNGTAAAGSDYVTASGTLSIPAGATTGTIPVTIIGETLYEANETFTVNLSSPVNATIARGQATGTITNDDIQPPPTVAISDVSVGEGGTVDPVFTVSLSSSYTQQVTVNYATADATGLATTDYVAASGTLTFAPGQTSKTIAVPLRRDDLPELAERVLVNLSAPVNATLADAQGVGTITDDDTSLATYEVNSQANGCYVLADTWNLTRSDRGAIYPNKPFNLTNKFDMTFKVSLGQYDLGGGGLVWLLSPSHVVGSEDMGYDGISPSVGVEIDTAANYGQDPPEDHIAVDHNGGACCHAGYPAVQASTTSPDIEDGRFHEIRVKRDPALGSRMDVWFDGSLRLSYYESLISRLGTSTAYWGVTGANNSADVPSPSNVISVCPTAVCIGDTATQHVLVDDVDVSERTATTVTFKVRIYCPRSQTVTVNYATANGTAVAGSDYVATSGALTFAPGETEKTVSVTLVRDSVAESAETFSLNLSNPSINLATPDTQAVARIVD
jgi:Calx-beta domain/Bacterial lectin